MKVSLKAKTIGGVALIEAALLILLIVTVVNFLTSIVDDMLVNRANTTATLFATTTKDAVLSYDLDSLEVFSEELMLNPDISYVKILNKQGVVLAQRGSEDELARNFEADASLVHVKDGIFDTFALIRQEEFEYGRIELGISIGNTQKAISKVQRWSTTIAVIELLLVGLFSFLLGSYLTNQLSELRQGSSRVRDALKTKDFRDVKVPVKGSDELSELAVSFNELIESLQQELALNARQKHDLQELNESLEAKVLERTKALSEKNDALLSANKEIKETQQQLLQAEKMASVGQLAAGVAHEINNPIGFVSSNLATLKDYIDVYQLIIIENKQLIQNENKEDISASITRLQIMLEKENFDFISEDIDDLIEESSEGLQRVIEIVGGLKLFSRANSDEKQLFNLNECIKTTLNMLKNELKYSCELNTDFGALPQIPINVGKMSQVITNILINAGQAIKSSGEFGQITISTQHQKGWVEIRIHDNGPGISETNQAKLFNPFFTTKEEGEGTGLGLSISIGIVNDHDGYIDVESKLGVGTTFVIRLPSNNQQIGEVI